MKLKGAQQTSFPTSAAEVTQPVAGAILHKEYVRTIGRMAYVWGWVCLVPSEGVESHLYARITKLYN